MLKKLTRQSLNDEVVAVDEPIEEVADTTENDDEIAAIGDEIEDDIVAIDEHIEEADKTEVDDEIVAVEDEIDEIVAVADEEQPLVAFDLPDEEVETIDGAPLAMEVDDEVTAIDEPIEEVVDTVETDDEIVAVEDEIDEVATIADEEQSHTEQPAATFDLSDEEPLAMEVDEEAVAIEDDIVAIDEPVDEIDDSVVAIDEHIEEVDKAEVDNEVVAIEEEQPDTEYPPEAFDLPDEEVEMTDEEPLAMEVDEEAVAVADEEQPYAEQPPPAFVTPDESQPDIAEEIVAAGSTEKEFENVVSQKEFEMLNKNAESIAEHEPEDLQNLYGYIGDEDNFSDTAEINTLDESNATYTLEEIIDDNDAQQLVAEDVPTSVEKPTTSEPETVEVEEEAEVVPVAETVSVIDDEDVAEEVEIVGEEAQHAATAMEEPIETVQESADIKGMPISAGSGDVDIIKLKKVSGDELRTIIKHMDNLLNKLPENTVEEFAHSKYFDIYERLFEDLEIKNF